MFNAKLVIICYSRNQGFEKMGYAIGLLFNNIVIFVESY